MTCEEEREKEKRRKQKIGIGIAFFILGGVILVVLLAWTWLRDEVFYLNAYNSPYDLWRCLWLLPFPFLGLAIRAIRWRKYENKSATNLNDRFPSPFFDYLMFYLVMLICFGFVLFSVFHVITILKTWIYYPLSAPIILIYGLAPGKAVEWIFKLKPKP